MLACLQKEYYIPWENLGISAFLIKTLNNNQ